jgi:drug/metabolite transporter (DMT)-like permease
MRPAHLILLLAMNLCWAGVYSAYKIIGQELPTGGIVTLRFGLAGVCLALFWPLYPGPAPRGRALGITCLMGVLLYVLGQRLQVGGNQLGTAGNSAVLMALEPLVTSVAAAVFLHEHLGPRRLAGFALGLFGVGLLNRVWSSDFQWTGLGASLVFVSSFICEAAYSVLGKPVVAKASVMKMLAISLLVGTGINLSIDGRSTLTLSRNLPAESWLLLVAMAVICTAVGYSLWFIVIRECPVSVAALTIFSQSLFGVGIAAIWLGEKLHWGHLSGGLAIVTGLVIGLSRQVHAKPDPS